MITLLFVICLTLGIWFSFINIGKVCYGGGVSTINCVIMSLALACTITMYIHGWY